MGFNNSKKQENSDRKIIYLDDAIDALNSKRVFEDNYNGRMWRGYRNENIEMAIEIIQSLPPAQLERETGEWVPYTYVDPDDWYQDKETRYRCSKCGAGAINKSNFCPNCGANMREER